jgi:hypothetical protein
MITIPKDNPGPKYKVTDKYRYNKPPTWKIGTSERPPIYTNEIFEYYRHPYESALDFSSQPKKWNQIKGSGSVLLAPKVVVFIILASN